MRYNADPEYKTLIQSAQWRRLRNTYIVDHPWCEMCLQHKQRTPATEVHHRQEVTNGRTHAERYALCMNSHNLMALCHTCHISLHSRQQQTKKQEERHQSRLAAFKMKYGIN